MVAPRTTDQFITIERRLSLFVSEINLQSSLFLSTDLLRLDVSPAQPPVSKISAGPCRRLRGGAQRLAGVDALYSLCAGRHPAVGPCRLLRAGSSPAGTTSAFCVPPLCRRCLPVFGARHAASSQSTFQQASHCLLGAPITSPVEPLSHSQPSAV
jgi:hypothetical protein